MGRASRDERHFTPNVRRATVTVARLAGGGCRGQRRSCHHRPTRRPRDGRSERSSAMAPTVTSTPSPPSSPTAAIEIRVLTPEHLDGAIDVLVRGFLEEPGNVVLLPDAGSRATMLEAGSRRELSRAMPLGTVRDGTSRCSSLAIGPSHAPRPARVGTSPSSRPPPSSAEAGWRAACWIGNSTVATRTVRRLGWRPPTRSTRRSTNGSGSRPSPTSRTPPGCLVCG